MKKLINKKEIEIIVHSKESFHGPIPICSDIMSKFKIGDTIEAGYEEAHEFSDSATQAHYYFRLTRKREETDVEYELRKKKNAEDKIELKNRRRATYLKLKPEFENENENE